MTVSHRFCETVILYLWKKLKKVVVIFNEI